ncbi:hypothetical protein [Singulisphaera sp. PoT]|uniref:hypothetical protein n=1 Tax=Singulisphaera sp. PoT TaxID=3411797 RepID=UPI003BF4FDF1
MSPLTASRETETSSHAQLTKLCSTIRGKLQFMDYLVRAAVADVSRFEEEPDAGTRIFIRQLIEMHAANLSVECENMRLVGELCNQLESIVNAPPAHERSHENGEAE